MLAVVASRSSSHLMAITASGGSGTGRRASTIFARSRYVPSFRCIPFRSAPLHCRRHVLAVTVICVVM